MDDDEDMRGVRLVPPLVHDDAFEEFQRISANPVIFKRARGLICNAQTYPLCFPKILVSASLYKAFLL